MRCVSASVSARELRGDNLNATWLGGGTTACCLAAFVVGARIVVVQELNRIVAFQRGGMRHLLVTCCAGASLDLSKLRNAVRMIRK